MQPFFARLRQFLGRLSQGQKIGLVAVALGTLGLLAGTAYWSSQPEYTLLFGDLNPENANRIVESLRQNGTPYELRDRGTAVYVPRASVHELRLQYTSEGMVENGQAGYELFNEGTLGMTDFMQKLNSKRALEGELARTISSIGQVEHARVHLVKPERDPFREQKTKASASVVLNLGGRSLSSPQIQGIAELVAGAVKKLNPAQVTVLDADGNMLSDPNSAENGNIQLTSTQLDMRRSVEDQLAKKGQSMLEEVIGTGNAIVRVSAELDFDRTVTRENLVDPNSATVISEERMRQGAGDSTSSTSTVRNFEVSRTKKRSEESVGDISRLTVSVVVNQERVDGEGGEPTYEPRSPEELNEIESLVKNAVGFDPERGDSFTIQQTRFDGDPSRAAQIMREQEGGGGMRLYLRYGLILLAIGAAIWIVRSIVQRLAAPPRGGPPQLQQTSQQGGQAQIEQTESDSQMSASAPPESLQEGGEEEEQLIADDMYTSKLSKEAKARLEARSEMFEEIQEQAKEHPEQTAEMIRAWLVDDTA